MWQVSQFKEEQRTICFWASSVTPDLAVKSSHILNQCYRTWSSTRSQRQTRSEASRCLFIGVGNGAVMCDKFVINICVVHWKRWFLFTMQRLFIAGTQLNDTRQSCMKLKKWQVVLSSHFLFVSLRPVIRWLSELLESIDDVLLFPLFIVLNGATDWSNMHLWHLTTFVAAFLWLNLCDWVREPSLWHTSKYVRENGW